MSGLDITSECEQLLRDIADLRVQLETTDNEEEKKINDTIKAKKSRYDDLNVMQSILVEMMTKNRN